MEKYNIVSLLILVIGHHIFLFIGWFVQECNLEEVSDEEPPSKSSKDKKANGPDSGKTAQSCVQNN